MDKRIRILVPLVIIIVLIILSLTRWTVLTTEKFYWGTMKYEKDEWTGYVFISKYGNTPTVIREPDMWKEPFEANARVKSYNRIVRTKNLATAAWWVLLAVSAVWLLVEFYRPRHQAPPET
jgi:hypothetical protein